MDGLIWLLLPVAALSGWMLARRDADRASAPAPVLSSEYFQGLNYLLHEQPDKAIECFVRMLEVDKDTVEIHLAVGNLFRQRGEVDRAIRIHQNLITRPALSRALRSQALQELALDYMRAGLFDRAENLCRELIEMEEYLAQALAMLSDIYQQEKEWQQAIAVTRRLQEVTGQRMDQVIAHFYCELAEQARAAGRLAEAGEHLHQALASDPHCVRASIIQGEMAAAAGDCKEAIRAYQQVEAQDPDYLSEIIPELVTCYQRRESTRELYDYLQKILEERGGVTVLLALVSMIEREQGKERAIRYLKEYLRERPSLRGVSRLMEMSESSAAGDEDVLPLFRKAVHRLLGDKPVYQCIQCGFAGRSLHWRCPGCKRWNTVKPIQGIEGE